MTKKLKKAYYLAPACASLVLILGLLYYFLLSDFSRCTETVYVCIDEDDTADSLYAKLEPSHQSRTDGPSYVCQPQFHEGEAAYGPLRH